jgi:Tol biopolymer transport system component
VLVASSRGGHFEPWVIDPAGQHIPRRIPVGAGDVATLAVSPDGRRFAFGVLDTGIGIGSLEPPYESVMLTHGKLDASPTFSRDGRTLYFSSQPEGEAAPRVLSVPVDGGEPEVVLGEGARAPVVSPTDDVIAYLAGTSDSALVPTIYSLRARTSRPLSREIGTRSVMALRFTADGRALGVLIGSSVFVVYDLSGKVVRPQAALPESVSSFEFTATGGLLFAHEKWVGDIWIADRPF